MIGWRHVTVAVLAVMLMLPPALAQARAGRSGGGSSFSGGSSSLSIGSRGSRTYSAAPGGGSAFDRTMTAPPSRPAYGGGAAPGYAQPGYGGGYQPGFIRSHPFLSGVAGGFIGSGLFGMLGGHSMGYGYGGYGGGMGGGGYGYGGSPTGSLFGLLVQLAILGGIGYWLYTVFFRNRLAGGGRSLGGFMPGIASASTMAPAALPTNRGRDVSVSQQDQEAFGQLLTGIQNAWSQGDLTLLRRMVTPEMLTYFSEELSGNASRGIQNKVEHLQFVSGNVAEAWVENDMEYATARLTWQALDYSVRLDNPQAVVEGSPTQPAQVTELWTFVRRQGGNWILSAIQQV